MGFEAWIASARDRIDRLRHHPEDFPRWTEAERRREADQVDAGIQAYLRMRHTETETEAAG